MERRPSGRLHLGVRGTWLKNCAPDQDALTDLSRLSLGPSMPSSSAAGEQVWTPVMLLQCARRMKMRDCFCCWSESWCFWMVQDLSGFDDHAMLRAAHALPNIPKAGFEHSLSMPTPKRNSSMVDGRALTPSLSIPASRASSGPETPAQASSEPLGNDEVMPQKAVRGICALMCWIACADMARCICMLAVAGQHTSNLCRLSDCSHGQPTGDPKHPHQNAYARVQD
jgi:hypothetical protein